MTASVENPFKHIVEPLDSQDAQQCFYNLCKLGDPRYGSSLMNHILVLFTSLLSMITKGFTLCLFLRASAIFHPDPPGVCCQEL